MARYRATRRETLKRKRVKKGGQGTAERGAQTDAEAEAETDEDYNPPESQERQKRQKQQHKAAAVPTVEEYPQAEELASGDDLVEIMDPGLFNESSMLLEEAARGDGDDEGNIFEAFFAENELFGGQLMGEPLGEPLGYPGYPMEDPMEED